MTGRVQIRVTGVEAPPRPPPLLTTARRSASDPDDEFLPPGALVAKKTFDVTPAARDATEASAALRCEADPDDLVLLELADGGTLITSAAGLQQTLSRVSPELIGSDGEILFEQFRVEAAAPGRGLAEAIGGLVSKVYVFAVHRVEGDIVKTALDQLTGTAASGVSWLATKAVLAAIEGRRKNPPGLYRWSGGSGTDDDLQRVVLFESRRADPAGGQSEDARFRPNGDPGLPDPPAETNPDGPSPDPPLDPPKGPMLVFVHGTGSSTLGSFGDLHTGERDLWSALESQYSGGIFACEHCTLSQSPIENALDLVRALPRGAQVSLVTHSRGGLVGDLLCLGDFAGLIEGYRYRYPGIGYADAEKSAQIISELADAHRQQRATLQDLAGALRDRNITIQRYVRIASPANGTLLASGNFDVFLSGLLTLIGMVPYFFGNPLYSAFKRVVIEIVKNRTNPHLVPGIEAMLPDSPMAQLLRDAPVRAGIQMAVIAGASQGGNLLRRLGELLTDFLLFDSDDNDFVVNTTSMLAGIAPAAKARVLFDRGAVVSHFRYFSNLDTRAALRDWLTDGAPETLEFFGALPDPADFAAALAASVLRDANAADRPVVVVLPGVMGSHLKVVDAGRLWFDPLEVVSGAWARIAWGTPSVEADEIFSMSYGRVCRYLADSHRVVPFPYDWRQPLDVLAERFGAFLDGLLRQTTQPIRLLAHSMGGLVVRACIHKRRPVMDALMARDGARLVMLGTPHQGAHSMVANLLGKGDAVRELVRLDLKHDLQQVLDIFADFPGALQLLPKPGFVDMFQDAGNGARPYDFQKTATWQTLRARVNDFWFGAHKAATPSQAMLDQASWLWKADGAAPPSLPDAYESHSVYVFGVAPNTPCGIQEQGGSAGAKDRDSPSKDGGGTAIVDGTTARDVGTAGTLKLVGTTHGDGTVTWRSGRIGGIGSFYYLPAAHGDLAATEEYFPALAELLTSGATARLSKSPPAERALERPTPEIYDAGPPMQNDAAALARLVVGGSLRNRVPPRAGRRLQVAVRAMDLRFLSQPIMVGRYERDPIAGAEALIDRELLNGDLSQRFSLGLYTGARGTATAVLRVPNDIERQRGSLTGAVVTGLGSYDRPLTPAALTEAVNAGALRYLLQVIDVLGSADRELKLATLLLGYNSTANLTVAASIEALVLGVMEANARFHETTRLNIRIARLDIVELYLDTAISAVYALRQLRTQLAGQAARLGTMLVCQEELSQGEGVRQRLSDDRNASYWPRLMITNADAGEDGDARWDAGAGAAAPVADRLRFLYVGQRARAETVALQRQPGAIETLVAQQIHDPVWNERFGRTLFQMMVPHDFKDAARQIERVVLVVDRTTANLPWELMLADDPASTRDERRPLAIRTPVVRQLATSRFRGQVRQGLERRALVIGNPSVAGFTAAFPLYNGQPTAQPPDLPGAQAEAETTATVLAGMDYKVESVIGNYQAASTVLSCLYEQPWRIVHISAHGVFDLQHRDGRSRSGVLLSDGLLITAAEIAAMEIVPELVFLNCCHLGKMDAGRGGNKLAASVARELIEIGVRCVIVAGWAVNDIGAKRFAQTFYEQLLRRRRPFGDAVFAARAATWQANPGDITWGAFQAYGDPGWLAEPRADGGGTAADPVPCASPEELLDELARMRAGIARRSVHLNEREQRAKAREIDSLLKLRCPPGWQALPQLQSALGNTWYQLDRFDLAREACLAAVQAVDKLGMVPILDIQRLANIEARLGEQRADTEIAAGRGSSRKALDAEALIDLALQRLDQLDALVGSGAPATAPADQASASTSPTALQPAPSLAPHAERSALRGSAWKRKASLQASRLLASGSSDDDKAAASPSMMSYLRKSIAAYQIAEGIPGSAQFSPYHALNRLALESLMQGDAPPGRIDASIALAQQCSRAAALRFAADASVWDAVIQADALLVEKLHGGDLRDDADAGRKAFEAVARAYADAMSNIVFKPVQVDSIVNQITLLARFFRALQVGQPQGAGLAHAADWLDALAMRIRPGRG